MRLQTDNLGKVAITIEKDYYIPDKSYDKLTVVQVKDKFATYVSRKPVPIGVCINNREYWIPFSSLKEDIVLDYNAFKDKYGKELIIIKERLDALEIISSRYLQLEDKVKELTELAEINIEKTDDLIKRAEAIIEEAEKNAAVINSMPALITTNPRTEYKEQIDGSKRLTLVEDIYSKDNQGLYRKDLLPKDIILPEARNIGNGEYVNGLMPKEDKQFLNVLNDVNVKPIHCGDIEIGNFIKDMGDYYDYPLTIRYKGISQNNSIITKDVTIPLATGMYDGLLKSDHCKILKSLYSAQNTFVSDLYTSSFVFENDKIVITFNSYNGYRDRFDNQRIVLSASNSTKAGIMTASMYNDLVSNTTKLNTAGTANGLAILDENGKIPANNLPSFVDDVVEYESFASFPSTGEGGKIYVDLTTNKTYRWGGTTYVEISASIALGETSTTAFPGDRGKTLETKVKSIESVNTTQTSNISLLANLLLNTSAEVKVSANMLVIEAGIDTSIDIQYNAYVAGNSISPVEDNVESQSLDLGGGITINKPIVNLELLNVTDNLILPVVINSNTVDVTLNKTTTIQLKGTFKNIGESDTSSIETNSVDKSDVITIHAYYPNYYSYEPGDSITIDDIKTSFIKAPLSPILNDEVLLSSSQRLNYVYVCIPNDIKSITDLINSVYEVGGLMIPMITISNVLINNKTYVLLRSETKLKGKTINIHVK